MTSFALTLVLLAGASPATGPVAPQFTIDTGRSHTDDGGLTAPLGVPAQEEAMAWARNRGWQKTRHVAADASVHHLGAEASAVHLGAVSLIDVQVELDGQTKRRRLVDLHLDALWAHLMVPPAVVQGVVLAACMPAIWLMAGVRTLAGEDPLPEAWGQDQIGTAVVLAFLPLIPPAAAIDEAEEVLLRSQHEVVKQKTRDMLDALDVERGGPHRIYLDDEG